jgi:hypothetical protein
MNRKDLLGLNQYLQEGLPVMGIPENGSLLITTAGNMVNGSGIFYPQWSGHNGLIPYQDDLSILKN